MTRVTQRRVGQKERDNPGKESNVLGSRGHSGAFGRFHAGCRRWAAVSAAGGTVVPLRGWGLGLKDCDRSSPCPEGAGGAGPRGTRSHLPLPVLRDLSRYGSQWPLPRRTPGPRTSARVSLSGYLWRLVMGLGTRQLRASARPPPLRCLLEVSPGSLLGELLYEGPRTDGRERV